jgi:hypothetical protein
MRLPSAAPGDCHSSRARFSDTSATDRFSYVSVHVKSRPAMRVPPTVFIKPGDANLKRRIGGISDSA